ncbi:unnamed protein product, partial [Angiostrongylus costaricensis]|uniref:beta-mannosidase n=1 Tax=Angiostrongylus costaricensis TaxID=334426 RepID=A0A158PG15_ANGCS
QVSFLSNGHVPGDVFSDLRSASIIDDPLFADNHLGQQWVSHDNWTYTRTFDIGKDTLDLDHLSYFLGIDTMSSVVLNSKYLLKTNNQFVAYFVKLNGILSDENMIEVRFTSPVLYAKEKSEQYNKYRGHLVPPVCPPPSYHGECHPNFIRKAQYSFSWDWGPALPTMGIWKPIDIVAFNNFFLDDFSWITERTHGFQHYIFAFLQVVIAELDVDQYQTYHISGNSKPIILKFEVEIAKEKVELWWPNGEGGQKLYNIIVRGGGNEIIRRIGFRHVELVQNYVDPKQLSKGRHFYVKINDRPVFLKGSNWIPVSMFLSVNNTRRIVFLLDSAAETGMNTLRVWGGGIYESDEFYDYADSKGILLWQDLMFACALYPTDKEFTENVRTEVDQQVWRIKRHSSVLLWAGNNENEIAIRSHWWKVRNYTENEQVKDYVYLYNGVVKPIVEAADPSRPFLMSSPSNGVRTEEEGGVSLNPGDPSYGDVHFYNEIVDLWRDSSYLTPRCATEFGVQIFPCRLHFLVFINIYTNQTSHPSGVENLVPELSGKKSLSIPFECPQSFVHLHRCEYLNSPSFIDRFAYFSQAHQAIVYKVQTEHYRRYRNRLMPSGMGNTMCALYWQLNDVWAAPTWSSIDINLNWKMVQYEARRFMAPVIVYASGFNDIGISVVNDFPKKITGAKLQIDMLAWTNGFEPVYKENKTVSIDSLSAEEIVDFDVFGDVNITAFRRLSRKVYSLAIRATSMSPFTWISVAKPFLGWFSDNGFTMTSSTREIKLYLRESIDLFRDDFSVCNLKNCGLL